MIYTISESESNNLPRIQCVHICWYFYRMDDSTFSCLLYNLKVRTVNWNENDIKYITVDYVNVQPTLGIISCMSSYGLTQFHGILNLNIITYSFWKLERWRENYFKNERKRGKAKVNNWLLLWFFHFILVRVASTVGLYVSLDSWMTIGLTRSVIITKHTLFKITFCYIARPQYKPVVYCLLIWITFIVRLVDFSSMIYHWFIYIVLITS